MCARSDFGRGLSARTACNLKISRRDKTGGICSCEEELNFERKLGVEEGFQDCVLSM